MSPQNRKSPQKRKDTRRGFLCAFAVFCGFAVKSRALKWLLVFGIICAFCAGNVSANEEELMKWKLTSEAFQEGELIPRDYTCEGIDVSPSLSWTAPPNGTKSLALVVDDPDAPVGDWVHWVIYNIPAKAPALPQGMPKEPR